MADLTAPGAARHSRGPMKTEHASVCPLDCPDTCSLTVTVEDTRIVNIRGSRANPYTEGVLCAKVPRAFPEFVHGERRLRTPLKRVGRKGQEHFVRVSWDEALDTIYTRVSAIIAEHGPQAVMPLNYGGPHGLLAGFSQGGAMALHTGLRHPERLAGLMGLSCFLPLADHLPGEASAANRATPIFMAHGTHDPLIPLDRARQARDTLARLGYRVEWHEYPMPHSVCDAEVVHIAEWLARILA